MAYDEPPILKAKINDRPALRDLSNFVVPRVSHKWYNLGLQLFDRRDEGILYNMKANSNKRPEDHCLEVFTHWLATKKSATWQKLIKSLRYQGVNLPNVADDIEKMLDSRSYWVRSKHKLMKIITRNQSLPPIVEGNPHYPVSTGPEASHGLVETFPRYPRSHGQRKGNSRFYAPFEDSSDPDESDGDELQPSYMQHSPYLPRTTSMQHLNLTGYPTRQRSATISENPLGMSIRASSLSEGIDQIDNKDTIQNLQAFKAQIIGPIPKPRTRKSVSPATTPGVTETYQNSHTDLSAKTLENMPSNLSQKPAEKIDNYASLEASHKTELENLQQQLHTLKNSLENKLTDLQEQLGSTKNSLSVKDTEIQTLKDSLWKDTEKLQQQLDRLQSNDKKYVDDIEKIQSNLSQMSEKNAEYEKRDKKYEMLIETLQRDINELKQQKSGYNHVEVDTYKNQIEAERQRAAIAEEALKQTSFELQEKQKETLKLRQSQRESQSTIQKLEDALRVSENELNSKITQYDKEMQQYKNLYAAERENTVKIQQLSAEIQERSKEALTAKKCQEELQSTVKKLEDALLQSKSQQGSNITEYTKEIQQYKSLIATEKENNVKIQDALTKLSTELQEKTEEALTSKKAQNELQSTVKELEDALMQSESKNSSYTTEYAKEIEQYKALYATEKENTAKIQETLSARLREKTEEALKAKNVQGELQLTVKKLEDALKQSQSENGSTEYTNEMQQYKTLYEIEKENTVNTQEDLTRMTTELQLKTEEILSLKESRQKWLHEKQNSEKQLQDISKQYDLRIKEMENNYKRLQVEKESANVQQLALQNTNSVLMQENKHLECTIKMLEDENSVLKVANKVQDRELLECSEKQNEKDTQKIADEKQDRQLLENFENKAHGDQEVSAMALTVKEQHYTLKEHFDEVLNEKQSKELAIRDLPNASEQSLSEVEKQKPKAENLEKLQQLSELPSPVDQDHKSNTSSPSEESFTIHGRGIDDQDDEVFQSEKSPLKDPPARISITIANKQSSETPINKYTTTEHKFMITSVQKNLVESSTKLLPTEHQSTDVLTKTQSTENHTTEHNVDTNEMQRSSSSVPQALHTQSEEHSVEHTPFGKRIKPFRRPKSPNIDEKLQNSSTGPVVDSQLQNFFAKRQKKLSDENALATFEQSVQESMESNRANIKQNNDGKIVKENPGDRGVDTELFTKFQKRRSKIPQN